MIPSLIDEIVKELDELESRGILFNGTDSISRSEARILLRASLEKIAKATREEDVAAVEKLKEQWRIDENGEAEISANAIILSLKNPSLP